jgi:hypothetical protein
VFQVLIASGPQASPGLQRFVLSIGVHVALIGTAAALARHPSVPTPSRPSEPKLVYMAPPPVRPSGPIENRAAPRPGGPLAPVWQPKSGLPVLDPVVLPATVPDVADLLHGATLITRPEPGPGLGETSAMTAGLDDAVEIIEQPDPRYPAPPPWLRHGSWDASSATARGSRSRRRHSRGPAGDRQEMRAGSCDGRLSLQQSGGAQQGGAPVGIRHSLGHVR